MRLASILAHVLASTTLVSSTLLACGGHTVGVEDEQGSSGSSGSGTSSGASSGGTNPNGGGKTPPTPLPPPTSTPRPTDASAPDASIEAGCTNAPVLVRNDGCAEVWLQTCGIPEGVNPSDGMSQAECDKVCGAKPSAGGQYWGCNEYTLTDLPGPSFECFTCVAGRRPQGYGDPTMDPTVAGWLAHAAELELVSIDAFQILRHELEHHGAPLDLIDRAMRAEADEVRHARVLSTLARRAGAIIASTTVHHGPVRSLVDVALENAVEGCIRETYGALVAGFQADHARRTDVRRVMQQIYRDETTHAELAWSVHEWIMERLSATDRERVTTAMIRSIAELDIAAASPVAADLVEFLGLPPARDARRLVAGLGAQLWAPALAA